MIKCLHCNGRQFIKQGNKMVPCPYCTTEDKLISYIKRAIVDAKKEDKTELAEKLESIMTFLPDYPVMAIMEAEALDLPEAFVIMLQDSFQVRPFMDVEYKKG